MSHDRFHDSAGVPWEGRSFQGNSWAGDDGTCPEELSQLFAVNPLDLEAIVSALGRHRLLIPLVATLGEGELGPNGLMVEKSADLGIVAVKTPDGKTAIPAFTSVSEMSAWNPKARPVPVDARKVALACASEGHERLVIDPAGRAVAVRRPALAALAQGLHWMHPARNPEVLGHVQSAAGRFDAIATVSLADGDEENTLMRAELRIELGLRLGLSPDQLNDLLHRFSEEIQTPDFSQGVDSIELKLSVA